MVERGTFLTSGGDSQSSVVPVDKVGTNVTWARTTHFRGPVFVSHTKDGDMEPGEKLKGQQAIWKTGLGVCTVWQLREQTVPISCIVPHP